MREYLKFIVSQLITALIIFIFLRFYGITAEHRNNIEMSRSLNLLLYTMLKRETAKIDVDSIQKKMMEK